MVGTLDSVIIVTIEGCGLLVIRMRTVAADAEKPAQCKLMRLDFTSVEHEEKFFCQHYLFVL